MNCVGAYKAKVRRVADDDQSDISEVSIKRLHTIFSVYLFP